MLITTSSDTRKAVVECESHHDEDLHVITARISATVSTDLVRMQGAVCRYVDIDHVEILEYVVVDADGDERQPALTDVMLHHLVGLIRDRYEYDSAFQQVVNDALATGGGL